MKLPNDPVMLLSYVNTQLRDSYSSLAELCGAFDLEQQNLEKKLEQIDYHYSAQQNQFI